jgi:hypothetical protein
MSFRFTHEETFGTDDRFQAAVDTEVSDFRLFTASMADSWNTTLGQSLINKNKLNKLKETGNFISEQDFNELTQGYNLKWNDKMTTEAAEYLLEQKDTEMQRQSVIMRGDDDFYSTMVGFGGGMVGSFHPVDTLALALVPHLGITGKITSKFARQNTISKVGKGLIQGASQGFKEAAAAEPFIMNAQKELQGAYTSTDSLMNILMGPVFGGTLGAVGGLKSGIASKTRDTQAAMTSLATQSLKSGEQVDPAIIQSINNTDPVVIKEQLDKEGWKSFAFIEAEGKIQRVEGISDEAKVASELMPITNHISEFIKDIDPTQMDASHFPNPKIFDSVIWKQLDSGKEVSAIDLITSLQQADPDSKGSITMKIFESVLLDDALRKDLEGLTVSKRDLSSEGAGGIYDSKTHKIELDQRLLTNVQPGEKYYNSWTRVFTHELVHAFTVRHFDKNPASKELIREALVREAKAFNDDLEHYDFINETNLSEEYINISKKEADEGWTDEVNQLYLDFSKKLKKEGIQGGFGYHYGLHNTNEFLSQMFSDPDFARGLREQSAEGLKHSHENESIYDYIIDVMRLRDAHINAKNLRFNQETGEIRDTGDLLAEKIPQRKKELEETLIDRLREGQKYDPKKNKQDPNEGIDEAWATNFRESTIDSQINELNDYLEVIDIESDAFKSVKETLEKAQDQQKVYNDLQNIVSQMQQCVLSSM